MNEVKKGILHTYRSYNFTEKDPVIDQLRTLVEDSGYSYQEISDRSDVSVACLTAWFHGKTRRPQFCTVQAVAGALGTTFILSRPRHLRVVKSGGR